MALASGRECRLCLSCYDSLRRRWYVNLEAEWVRTPIGFDTRDLILDVTVADDRSSWCLKDEQEINFRIGSKDFLPYKA